MRAPPPAAPRPEKPATGSHCCRATHRRSGTAPCREPARQGHHPGKPGGVELQAAETVEQPVFAPGLLVARRRMPLRHKEILDREPVAAGSLETDHMPDVGHPRLRLWEQHRADDRGPVGMKARGSVGFEDRHMAAEPNGVVAAAGKAPIRGDAIAALDDPRRARPRTPGENAARSAETL